jgi:DNA polymerase (family 10)
MENRDIAAAFSAMADLLEIQEANPFRVRAYRNAARTVAEQTRPLRDLLGTEGSNKELLALPGIGKDMAASVREMIESGRFAALDALKAEVPAGLGELVTLPALGPKRARLLWKELGVTSLAELETALRGERVAAIKGFGKKTQDKLLEALGRRKESGRRLLLGEVDPLVASLVAHLEAAPGVGRVEAAGSFRRRRETVGDLDLLATAADPGPVMDRFASHPQIGRVEARGPTRSTATLISGLQVDLRVVPAESFGAALVYFTGSKAHNVKLRQRGVARKLRISEYGVFRGGDVETGGPLAGRRVAGRTEEEVYASVGLPWIPPELREDRGELEAAAAGALPRLLEESDLRGDLQMHTTWSDGRDTLEAMAAAAQARGYEYIAITDHSEALAMVRGLDAARMRQQAVEIECVRRSFPELRILRSMEVDIHGDGSLDLDDESLALLDLVVVSVHSQFSLPAEVQTDRLLRAIEHPCADVLAHPTGRRLGRRDEMRYDVERVLRRCAELGVAVEANAHPQRLDLRDTHLIRARELGVKIVVSTDAHRAAHLAHMRYGVEQARRAWLEPRHVLNTRPWKEFQVGLRRRPRPRRR